MCGKAFTPQLKEILEKTESQSLRVPESQIFRVSSVSEPQSFRVSSESQILRASES